MPPEMAILPSRIFCRTSSRSASIWPLITEACVDLHQHIGAALQIEAEHDLAQRNEAGEPRGERVDRLSRHEARHDDQHRGRHERQDGG